MNAHLPTVEVKTSFATIAVRSQLKKTLRMRTKSLKTSRTDGVLSTINPKRFPDKLLIEALTYQAEALGYFAILVHNAKKLGLVRGGN